MENLLSNIIDKVKTFTLDSLIEQAMFRISKNPPVTQPWILLSFLEIVYRECDNNILKFNANYRDFDNIYNQLFKLTDSHPFADFTRYSPSKIFHVLAYQQFPYQIVFCTRDIRRQFFLFNAENSNSRLNNKLKEEYGFTISEFLKLWEDLMSETEQASSPLTAEKLWRILTISHEEVSKNIKNYSNGIGNDFYKNFYADFFIKYPFIEFKKQRFCIDLRLFSRTINEFLFERILDWHDVKGNFDERFQEYVNYTLQNSNVNYKDDNILKLEGHNECDFFIEEFLFVECKAVRLKPLAQVNPSDRVLKNNLEHIIKAYKQIISTANRYRQPEYFGVIITFLPFYFSDGTDIWDLIEVDIQKYLEENKFDLLVEPNHLFFIDIRSWDKLIDYVLTNPKTTLREIFQRACNTNKINRQFEFSMHLRE